MTIHHTYMYVCSKCTMYILLATRYYNEASHTYIHVLCSMYHVHTYSMNVDMNVMYVLGTLVIKINTFMYEVRRYVCIRTYSVQYRTCM